MDHVTSPGNPPPTSKEKNAVQREVGRLLDELAPERTSAHAGRSMEAIQRHRTPTGCILQGANAALSVTWYVDAAERGRVGELQIVLWRGIVSRRGSGKTPEPAEVVRQEVVNPVERPTDECIWRSDDGTGYDTTGLIAHCVMLLEAQLNKGD
ncbi:MAG TPA: hypothetical protein VN706_04790 [Gemmatimonadaceae bacterium]|nr:hypothetical protein [Gemmatimonadaceae bacterium]